MPEIKRPFEHKSLLEGKKGMITLITSNKYENPMNTEMLIEAFVFEKQVLGSLPRFRRFELTKSFISIVYDIYFIEQDKYHWIIEEIFDKILLAIEGC